MHKRTHICTYRGNEQISPPESKPNRAGVWQIVKCKGANVQRFANVCKTSPHLDAASLGHSLPPCQYCLPFNMFTFSSFDFSLSFFFNVTKVKFLAFPSQAEPNTAPTGFEECVTMTLVSG